MPGKKVRVMQIAILIIAVIGVSIFFAASHRTSEINKEKKTAGVGNLLADYLNINHWKITLGDLGDGFKISKLNERVSFNHNSAIIEAEKDDEKFTSTVERLLSVNSNFADSYLNDKKSFVESSYVKSLSAYPDVLTNTIECPSEFKPKKYEKRDGNVNILAYDILTNDRFSYGICSKDLITHEGYSVSVYCPASRELYNLELLWPTGKYNFNFEKELEKIKCQNN